MDGEDIHKFWDATRAAASQEQESGYLADGWPIDISLRRFEGERNWIEKKVLPRVETKSSMLDVGCGTGLWLEHLARHFEHASGVDLSQEMVNSAKARMQRRGIHNVRLRQGRIEDLASVEERFDFIFVGGVLMYLKDDVVPDALRTLTDRLQPGGIAVFRESTYKSATYYRDKPIPHGLLSDPSAPRPRYQAIYRTVPILRTLLNEAGLVIVDDRPNIHYKLADMKKTELRFLDKLPGTRVRDRERAERWARRLHRMRHLTIRPAYAAVRWLRLPAWKMDNHWFVCRKDP